jgi:hypothetical protein
LLLNDNIAKLYEPMVDAQKEVHYSAKERKHKADAVMAKLQEKEGEST